MMNLLFGSSAELEIALDGAESRLKSSIKVENDQKELLPVYYDGETVSGRVNVKLKQSKMEHYGIKVELFGVIEQFSDRTNRYEFLTMSRDLARPGSVTQDCSYAFEFVNVEKPYESYSGVNVKLRYFLRVTVVKRISDLVKEHDLVVHTLAHYPDSISGIKMEVGIENCLHIEFEYSKSKYHLRDVIVGKIYFLLVRVKVRHMEVQILRREQVGMGPACLSDSDTVAKFEIMDGAPVRGETIPIRLFLSGYDLGPTMRDIGKRFSVRYFLNLVLIDEEDRRYFKQQEVTLFRRSPGRGCVGGGGNRSRNNPHMETSIFHHRTPQLTQQQHQHQHHEEVVAASVSNSAVAAFGSENGDDACLDRQVDVSSSDEESS